MEPHIPCTNCGEPIVPLPCEPLFEIDQVASLLCTDRATLRTFLHRQQEAFPARYTLRGRGHRRHRLLLASEVRRLRVMVGPLRHGFAALEAMQQKS